MKNLYILSIIIFLVSCGKSENLTSTENVIHLNKKKEITDSLLFDSISVIKLQENPLALIRNIDKIIEYEGKYIILDKLSRQVLLYNNHGAHLITIHRVGNGPGEYVQIRDIAVDHENNSMVILADPSKILYYDLEGNFLNESRMEEMYNSILIVNNYIYLQKSTYVNNKKTDYTFSVIYKDTGKSTDFFKTLFETAPYCFSGNYFLKGTTYTSFVRKFDDTIYRIENNEIFPLYQIDFGKNKFPVSRKNEIFNCEDLNKLCFENKYIYSMSDIKETENYIFFKTNLPGIYLIDKNNHILNEYFMIKNVEYDFYLPTYMPIEGENDLLAFIYPAYQLSNLKSKLVDNKTNSDKQKEFMEIIKDIDDQSNPVLFIYRIKK